MSQKKTVKKRQEIDLHLKSELTGVFLWLNFIEWNSSQNKFFLLFESLKNPIKTLDPETKELQTPIELRKIFYDMKFTKKEDKLIIIDGFQFLFVIELKLFKIIKKYRLPDKYIYTFVFVDQSSKSIYINSEKKGLYKMDLNSGESQQLNFKGFKGLTNSNFIASSNCNLLYGNLKIYHLKTFPVSYNVSRGFKYRVFGGPFHKLKHSSKTLSSEETLLFLGNRNGTLAIRDLRSCKYVRWVKLMTDSSISCLKSRNRLLYGGINNGHLFIMRESFPFSIIFYQKINIKIYSIGLSQRYLLIGGDKNDPIKVFEIPEIQQK